MRRLLKRTYYGAVGVTVKCLGTALRPLLGGVGSILMFHRVQLAPSGLPYGPSRDLVVSLDTFRRVVEYLRRAGNDIVSLDETLRRLRSGVKGRPFVSLTFDDGYRDTYELVYPICRELKVPITIYVTTDMIEERLLLWQYGLSAVVEQARGRSGSLAEPPGRSRRLEGTARGRRRAEGRRKSPGQAALMSV